MSEIDWSALERGCCSRAQVVESNCRICMPKFAAIDRLKAIVSAGDRLHHAAVNVSNTDATLFAADAYDRARRRNERRRGSSVLWVVAVSDAAEIRRRDRGVRPSVDSIMTTDERCPACNGTRLLIGVAETFDCFVCAPDERCVCGHARTEHMAGAGCCTRGDKCQTFTAPERRREEREE